MDETLDVKSNHMRKHPTSANHLGVLSVARGFAAPEIARVLVFVILARAAKGLL